MLLVSSSFPTRRSKKWVSRFWVLGFGNSQPSGYLWRPWSLVFWNPTKSNENGHVAPLFSLVLWLSSFLVTATSDHTSFNLVHGHFGFKILGICDFGFWKF